MKAKELARVIAASFLAGGNYTDAAPFGDNLAEGIFPAGATTEEGFHYINNLGFAGLAVHSVGYEEGGDDERVHVYVTKGQHKAEHEVNENVEVVVNRIGRVTVRPDQAASTTRNGNVFNRSPNQIACGSSCAPSTEKYAGTLGALVRKADSDQLYVLSNNHVLAAGNHTPVGMPILSPSTIDSRPGRRAPTEICRHSEICELRSGEPALVPPAREDIAIAMVPSPGKVSSWQGDNTSGYDTPTIIVAPKSGSRVKKFGRTTGLTLGIVESRLLPFPIPYKCRHFSATVWFSDVWTIRGAGDPFALPGDSGSLVVTENAEEAVGLIFAVSARGDYGIMIPMNHVAAQFGGLSLVKNHGI